MNSQPIIFSVLGVPIAKGRAKFARRGNFVTTYTPEKTARYENLVKMAAQHAMAGSPAITGPVTLACRFVMPIPASYSKKRAQACLDGQEPHCKKPDLDNLLKSIKDGCNGVVWRDDCQVVALISKKHYGDCPLVVVEVKEMVNEKTRQDNQD